MTAGDLALVIGAVCAGAVPLSGAVAAALVLYLNARHKVRMEAQDRAVEHLNALVDRLEKRNLVQQDELDRQAKDMERMAEAHHRCRLKVEGQHGYIDRVLDLTKHLARIAEAAGEGPFSIPKPLEREPDGCEDDDSERMARQAAQSALYARKEPPP
jgi:outer membrane murein-binding lipoprotein Lpp